MATALERGGTAYRRREWSAAYSALGRADEEHPLDIDGVERLAVAAYLLGRDDESVALWTRAYALAGRQHTRCRAARCAFWLALALFLRGRHAQAGGWFARARSALDEHAGPCPVSGLLLVSAGLRQLGGGESEAAYENFTAAGELGATHRDCDLLALSRLGAGQALIRLGRIDEGQRMLDEAMVGVTADEVMPIVAGTIYCAVLLECQALGDLRRAAEWTEALSTWSGSDPQVVAFRGQCLVHRAEVLFYRGDWSTAMAESDRACDVLSRPPPQPAAAMAYLQRGDLCRMRGDLRAAEDNYFKASGGGLDPEPGLALLRLAQGRHRAADAAIRGALGRTTDPRPRIRLLAAATEIALAGDDPASARTSADELALLAERLGGELPAAIAASASGAVLLAERAAAAAAEHLQRARQLWQALEVPFEVARVRLLLGDAYHELGDAQAARLEQHAARSTFERLGAVTHAPSAGAGGLSAREREVLALVARGMTNHQIAGALTISDHTVRRHLQNIFAKIDVSTRAAAAGYAVRRGWA